MIKNLRNVIHDLILDSYKFVSVVESEINTDDPLHDDVQKMYGTLSQYAQAFFGMDAGTLMDESDPDLANTPVKESAAAQ